ncbi:MAG: hypothetical protein AVDCRST_MAG49-4281, partial [uncultured Thermomicrobiales bacterium]
DRRPSAASHPSAGPDRPDRRGPPGGARGAPLRRRRPDRPGHGIRPGRRGLGGILGRSPAAVRRSRRGDVHRVGRRRGRGRQGRV